MSAQTERNALLERFPYSIESEQAVIGALLLDAACIDRIPELRPEHFYREDHRLIFAAMVRMAGANLPIDILTVTEQFERTGTVERMGGLAYLGEIANNTPSAANVAAYARRVRETAMERELLAASADIAARVQQHGDVREKLNYAQERVMALGEQAQARQPRPMREALIDHMGKMESRLAGECNGLPTGFPLLDSALHGLKSGNLVYLAGRPGTGKTTLAVNIAEHAALSGSPVLLLSLEMGEGEIVDRSIASIGRIGLDEVLAGCPEQGDMDRYTNAVGKLADIPLLLDEQGNLTLQEVRAKARSVKRKHGLSLLVIDYLQLMAGDGDNENAILTGISKGLKGLAKELQIPIICLSQLNRELEKRQNKRPVMADLRGSGSIEQDADVILFVYRDEVYNPESQDKGTAEIIIGKNRQGKAGMVRLAWNGRCTRFDNLAESWTPNEAYVPIVRKSRGGFRGE